MTREIAAWIFVSLVALLLVAAIFMPGGTSIVEDDE